MCRYEVVLDDAMCPILTGLCICVRCFNHEVGNDKPLPADLRRMLEALMAGAS